MEAFVAKGIALCSLLEYNKKKNKTDNSKAEYLTQIQQIYLKLYSICNELDKDFSVYGFLERHALANEHYARFIKLVSKSTNSNDEMTNGGNSDFLNGQYSIETENKLKWAFKQLKWDHLYNHMDRSVHVKFPKAYRLF